MSVRRAIVLSGLLAVVGTALGQSQRIVYTQRNDQFNEFGAEPTGPDVAVSGLAAVVCGSKQIALYSRTTTLPAPGPLDLRFLPDPAPDPGTMSPFTLSTSSLIDRFLDPRATYDSVNDRLWIVYSEADGDKPTGDCGSLSRLHIAVSKDPASFMPTPGVLDSLGTGHWWYITGDTDRMASPPVGAFDLSVGTPGDEFKPYKNETVSNFPFDGVARLPTIAIDGTRASGRGVAVITPNEFEPDCDSSGSNSPLQPQLAQALLIVPLEHEDDMGNALSILDGDRPDENDIIMLQLIADTSLGETDRVQDFAEAAYAVQEPFEAYDNAVFLISGTSDRVDATRKDGIRLKGLFYDGVAPTGEWTLQQRISNPGTLEDMDINGNLTLDSAFAYHDGLGTASMPRPRTPDMTALNWAPAAVPSIFHSAVLTEDTEGNPRIFAVHSVFPIDPNDPMKGLNEWVVQWYVIDPNLANFRNTPAPSAMWEPTIIAKGRIDSENGFGDRYHPVIVVNRQGQAFIEYTYSDEDTWPEIRRVRLNSSYTAIVGTETQERAGPLIPYEEAPVGLLGINPLESWANFAGAQADPLNNCAYWTTHTLVHDDPVEDPTDKRDVLLFHQAYSNSTGPNCFQSNSMLDLNDDNEVDSFDMVEFGPMFDRRARRVDIDGNGVVDATDMTLFIDAYDGYTARR